MDGGGRWECGRWMMAGSGMAELEPGSGSLFAHIFCVFTAFFSLWSNNLRPRLYYFSIYTWGFNESLLLGISFYILWIGGNTFHRPFWYLIIPKRKRERKERGRKDEDRKELWFRWLPFEQSLNVQIHNGIKCVMVLISIASGPCPGPPGLNVFGRLYFHACAVNSPILKTKKPRCSFICPNWQVIFNFPGSCCPEMSS